MRRAQPGTSTANNQMSHRTALEKTLLFRMAPTRHAAQMMSVPADTLRTRFANNYCSHFSVRESKPDMSHDSNATDSMLSSVYHWVETA